ncbi:MAG TPA: Uma2 family endonuclease [Gemmataceae bacterium]|nr:Uma2 family endonuclease [Gemmataceae bacterium]
MSSLAPPIHDDDLYEVIGGKRVLLSKKSAYCALIAGQLAYHVGNFADSKQAGRIAIKGLFHLTSNCDRRPDVAFVSYGRWLSTRSVPRTDDAWNVVPNLAAEVISPRDSAEGVEQKISEYFKAGVEIVWVVHPSQNKIHVYDSPTQIQVLTISDVLDGRPALPGFRLPLVELFAEPSEDKGS